MHLGELERKLIAAAKAHPPSDAVSYAFEQRIIARLHDVPVSDVWADWARALWRAAAPCVAIAIFIGVWSAFTPEANSKPADFSQAFEQTIFVAVTQDSNSAW